MFAELFVLCPQLVGRQLFENNSRELPGAEPAQIRCEKINLGAAQAIAQYGVVGDFLQVPREFRIVLFSQRIEFLRG